MVCEAVVAVVGSEGAGDRRSTERYKRARVTKKYKNEQKATEEVVFFDLEYFSNSCYVYPKLIGKRGMKWKN